MEIELQDLEVVHSKGTPFEKKVFSGFNLKVKKGDFVVVKGKNGSGKTTLLQVIALIIKPTSGRVLFNGEDAWENRMKWRKRIGFSFQFPENQFFNMTVFEEVTYAPKNFGLKDVENAYKNAMEIIGLPPEDYRNSIPFTLSGGEKRKIGIASIVAHNPDVLILDEPLVSLDWPSKKEMISFLEDWKERGKTVIIATHKLELFKHLCDVLVAL